MQAIIDRLDAQFADPGYKYALLRREDWQTLKAAVLAQQAKCKSHASKVAGVAAFARLPNRWWKCLALWDYMARQVRDYVLQH